MGVVAESAVPYQRVAAVAAATCLTIRSPEFGLSRLRSFSGLTLKNIRDRSCFLYSLSIRCGYDSDEFSSWCILFFFKLDASDIVWVAYLQLSAFADN